MMLRAIEARIMMKEAEEKVIAKRKARAMEYCENELSKVIEEKAKAFGSCVVVTVDEEIKKYVIENVKYYGYETVENADNSISIKW